MKITWLGQGGYLIEHAGRRLAIDPYLTDALARLQNFPRLVPPPIAIGALAPDIVFITHDHLDHFDPETLQPLLQQAPRCLLAGPASVIRHGRLLGMEEQRLVLVHVGAMTALLGFALTPTPAQHSDASAVGLLVKVGARMIYISGDTLYSPALGTQVRALAAQPLDAAFVCINGRLGNMNATDAAALVAQLQPGVAVPMHYGLFAGNTADPQDFVAACRTHGQPTRLMQIGGTMEL